VDKLFWVLVGAGLIWHGAQIIWVAPTPTQFLRQKPVVEPGSAQAFQVFWLDQYGWIGIVLTLAGVAIIVLEVLS
jgi:hypothetical protein